MAHPPIPNVVAMLLCDQIINEQGTNKKSLIGVFDNFMSYQFPAIFQRLAVYVKLADAKGDYKFKLRLVNLKDESLLSEVAINGRLEDISSHSELALNFGNIVIPEQGKYEFQLYSGEEYLHRITMMAKLVPPPQGGSKWQPQK